MISSDWRSQIFGKKKQTKKKQSASRIWSNVPKSGPKLVFFHFLKFGLLVFIEIEWNFSLQQCLTSSRGKIREKNFGTQIWAKGAKIWPETRFFAIFLSLVH